MDASQLTIQQAQRDQPWTVPYSMGVIVSIKNGIPHILGSHTVLHAAKTVGKLAAVFEKLDHKGNEVSMGDVVEISHMAADLVTEALRLANLYGFDLASVLIERVKEKNGYTYTNKAPNVLPVSVVNPTH